MQWLLYIILNGVLYHTAFGIQILVRNYILIGFNLMINPIYFLPYSFLFFWISGHCLFFMHSCVSLTSKTIFMSVKHCQPKFHYVFDSYIFLSIIYCIVNILHFVFCSIFCCCMLQFSHQETDIPVLLGIIIVFGVFSIRIADVRRVVSCWI